MSSSIWQSMYLRIFAVTITLAVGFSVTFYVYYKDQRSPFGLSMITKTTTENNAKLLTRKEGVIVIIIWFFPYGFEFFDLDCAPFNITGCLVTANHGWYYNADGIMIHHYDTLEKPHLMPKLPRPPFQKWIWWTTESPVLFPPNPETNNLYNLTCNYRRDSDIFTPYGTLVPLSKEDGNVTRIPLKNKLVCWICSHWKPKLERVPYYNELKKHIDIETYGNSFGRKINNNQYAEIVKSCKFYLAFENAIQKDYITEKFFRPLELGTVPVVLGPPRDDYEYHAPGNSFIHVNDFSSPKELAEKLKYLDQHQDEYMRYFEWKNLFKVVNMRFGQEQACRTCQYLKKYNRYQNFRNLNKWYWGK